MAPEVLQKQTLTNTWNPRGYRCLLFHGGFVCQIIRQTIPIIYRNLQSLGVCM